MNKILLSILLAFPIVSLAAPSLPNLPRPPGTIMEQSPPPYFLYDSFGNIIGTTSINGVDSYFSITGGSLIGDGSGITGTAPSLTAGYVTNGVYTTGAGTVFLAPNGSAAALTSFPTLNQNTTGNATTATSATTATNIAGGAINQAVIQTAAGVTSFLGYDNKATGSTLMLRDYMGNTGVNNVYEAQQSTTSAGATTTLTAFSTHNQRLTGTLNQTYQLPDATSLANGWNYEFDNDSTGTLTIKNGSGTTLFVEPAGSNFEVTTEDSTTVAGVWYATILLPDTYTASETQFNLAGSLAIQVTPEVNGATYSVLPTDSYIPVNFAGTVTLTLPTPTSPNVGRILKVRTYQAQTVVSASSNVSINGSVGTAILSATAGKWAELISDGTNWEVSTNN